MKSGACVKDESKTVGKIPLETWKSMFWDENIYIWVCTVCGHREEWSPEEGCAAQHPTLNSQDRGA